MSIYKAYRYRLYPTEEQKRTLAQHFGAVRFVYNWGLETKKKAWEESGERVSRFDLQGQLPGMKKNLTWLKTACAQSLQVALQNLDSAFSSFFKGQNGQPKFKAKTNRQTLTFPQDVSFDIPTNRIMFPKIGYIKCVISRQFEGKLKSATITKTPTGKYFVSCLIQLDIKPGIKPEPVEVGAIGIDLGIKTFATLSNGETIASPSPLSKSLKALRRASRKYSKKKKGSKNKEKSRLKLARLHEKVTNQRLDFLHKTSTTLIRENQTVCIEDLCVKGWSSLPNLALHAKDSAFGLFRQFLIYKASWYSKNVLMIDRFAPSSKQCTCGHKNTELTLKQRTWTCGSCGTTHDRDLLAAQNIVKFAFHPETINKEKIGRGTPELAPVETLAVAGR